MQIIQSAGIRCLWTSRQGPQNSYGEEGIETILQKLISLSYIQALSIDWPLITVNLPMFMDSLK
jgi:hypothetical protein